MQYMLLIYEDEASYADEGKARPMMEKHMDFAGSLGATLKGGAGLKNTDTATTVRTAGGAKTLHDGPFAETKEQLGGIYIVDVADLDAAIALAKQVPLRKDGAIEVRPLLDMG